MKRRAKKLEQTVEKWTNSISITVILKGQFSEFFLLHFFSLNNLPWCQFQYLEAISNFFKFSWSYSYSNYRKIDLPLINESKFEPEAPHFLTFKIFLLSSALHEWLIFASMSLLTHQPLSWRILLIHRKVIFLNALGSGLENFQGQSVKIQQHVQYCTLSQSLGIFLGTAD